MYSSTSLSMCLSPSARRKACNLCLISRPVELKQAHCNMRTYTFIPVVFEGVHCALQTQARRKSQGSQLINISRIYCSAAVCFLWQPNVMQGTFASCNLIRYHLFHNTARPVELWHTESLTFCRSHNKQIQVSGENPQ